MENTILVHENPRTKCGFLYIPAAHYGQTVREMIKDVSSGTRTQRASPPNIEYVLYTYENYDIALQTAIQIALVTGLEVKIEE